jgi:hypothetical protein
MFHMVQEHYWTVLPYSSVRSLASLKLAPAGVVPQRERRPRPIVDYSFTDINQHALPIAPYHAMQFGTTLPRLLQRLVYANKSHGPPLMCKIDLSDGYYRVPLNEDASLQLAVILPPDNMPNNLIALPLSLPMGWKESPPYFCAFTETIADSSNSDLALGQTAYPDHPLLQASQLQEHAIQPVHFLATAIPPIGHADMPPLSYTDVYMDDFCLLAQPPVLERTLNTVLQNIDAIFKDPPYSPCRQIISQSKLDKGDATWSTKKRLLGWDIDTESMTLTIPAHRCAKLLAHIEETRMKGRVSRRNWQQLLGELRSIALAIPSSKYLFSIVQHALVEQRGNRIYCNRSAFITLFLQPRLRLPHVMPPKPAWGASSCLSTTVASQ